MDRDRVNNYLSVAIALSFTCDGLKDFIIDSIKSEHKKILQKLPRGLCKQNCSRKHGDSFRDWCSICITWKDELCGLHRHKRQYTQVNWKEFDTVDFRHATSDSFEALSKLFVKHDTGCGLFKDISALMSLLINMKCFDVDRKIIKQVQHVRNKHNAHNNTASVDTVDKILCIDKLITLLKVPAISRQKSAKKAIPFLTDLKRSDEIPESVLLQATTIMTLTSIENSIFQSKVKQNEIVSKTNTFRQTVTEYKDKHRVYHERANRKRKSMLINLCAFWWISHFVLILLALLIFQVNVGIKEKREGCLSLTFNEHWQNELDFDYHVNALHNESFIERTWLKEIVGEHLTSDSGKGVLITADMGFGKSSLVSNIVCAENSSVWYTMRQEVLLYHFCRYDVSLSLHADVFIRNMAGALVKRYPDLGKYILASYKANYFLYGTHCSNNPVACFENAILDPLQGKWGKQQFIIIVDGLDECSCSDESRSLLNLLYTQIDKFPTNVKFVFTTRRIEHVYKHFKNMAIVELNHTNEECNHDIEEYIQMVGDGLSPKQITTLITEAKGNFLLVKQYLNSCIKFSGRNSDEIPDTLEKWYDLNFARVFKGKMELFDELLSVLAVLCASEHPLTENEIFLILKMYDPGCKRKIQRLLRNELGHFVKIFRGEISFVHKSFQEFLTDENRRHSDFFIDRKEGHSLLARYYLGQMNASVPSNVATLVHHVAMSQQYDYKALLFDMEKKSKTNSNNLTSTSLHDMVEKYNSYLTIELFIKLTSFNDLDVHDDHNFTAAFLAAKTGHHESLRCLLDYDVNLNFKAESLFFTGKKRNVYLNGYIRATDNSSILSGQEFVYACKYVFFCGYNLIHIAAQNGHTEVVRLLVKWDRKLIFEKNDLNLNAFHLASENGHYDIIKIAMDVHKDFADKHALYQASKNGHIKVVQLLLNHGVEDTCLPCNGSFYWLPPFAQRRQNYFKYDNIMNCATSQKSKVNYILYDDWRLITCDTALNVAVHNGHESIVHVLLRQPVNAINCSIYDGKTPLMTAAKYNRDQIFKMLYLQGSSLKTRCFLSRNKTEVTSMLSKSEFESMNSQQCPSGASVFHILAAYGNNKILVNIAYQMRIEFKEDRDENLSTPLHYAFCHTNHMYRLLFYNKLSHVRDPSTYRSKNGSTPFHSAAICSSQILLLYTDDPEFITNASMVPDTKDYENRSILQYGMMHLKNNNSTYTTSMLNILLKFSYVYKHNFYHKDKDGRNFLHYAAKNGLYKLIVVLLAKFPDIDLNRLLTQRDTNNRTPIEEAFHSLPQKQIYDPVQLPILCEIEDIFRMPYEVDLESLLSNHEMFIFYSLAASMSTTTVSSKKIKQLFAIAILKRSIYSVWLLSSFYAIKFTIEINQQAYLIEYAINQGIPIIANFILTEDNALNCKGGYSPLHRIVMNERNSYGGYCNVKFLNKYLSRYEANFLDHCLDGDGYNLLHRAVIGGNLIAVKYLTIRGMNMSLVLRSGLTPLALLLQKAPFHHNGILPTFYNDVSKSHTFHYMKSNSVVKVLTTADKVNFEETAVFLLQSKARTCSFPEKCNSRNHLRKILYLAAAKGFLKFLKVCKSLYGLEILNCRDQNNITVRFLANLYNQTEISRWIRNYNTDNVMPSYEVTNYLVYNLIDNYRLKSRMDWTCYIRIHFRYRALIRNQVKRCLYLVKNHESVVIFGMKSFDYNIAYHLNNLITTFNHQTPLILTNEHLKYCYYSLYFKRGFGLCSSYTRIENIARKREHRLTELIYARLPLLLTFGPFDKIFNFKIITMYPKFQHSGKKSHDIGLYTTLSSNYTYLSMFRMEKELHRQWLHQFSITVSQETNIGLHEYINFNFKNFEKYVADMENLRKINREVDLTVKRLNEKVLHNRQSDLIKLINNLIVLWEDIFDTEDLLKTCKEINNISITNLNEETVSDLLKTFSESTTNNRDIKRKIKRVKKNAHHILKLLQKIPTSNRCLDSHFFIANEVIKVLII